MKLKIKKWRSVASWKWLVGDEDCCGICRQAFEGCCPQCKFPGDDCPPMWGQCKHVFHMHCVLKWIQTSNARGQCPLCRQEWEILQVQ